MAEALFACALAMIHLSRWAEEIVLWTSSEFGFARLDDRAAKGSSIMPQKKNPEPAEILRGKSGRAVGGLVGFLVTLKGLPLTYNSDLQEDKRPLFDAFDTVTASFGVAGVLATSLGFDREAMAAALSGAYITSTDLADLLVVAGVPFRSAHERTGAIVRLARSRGVELWQLEAQELAELVPEIEDVETLLREVRPESSLAAHQSFGGPAPDRVAEQIEEIAERLDAERRWLEAQEPPPIYRAHRNGELLAPTIRGAGG